MPTDWSVAEYSAIERRAVSLECRIRAMLRASDGDIHLECAAPDTEDARYVTAEITPVWRDHPARRGVDSPGWGYEQLAADFRPGRGTTTRWEGGPARVRLTGWLMLDTGGDVIEKVLRMPILPRQTNWEIHPVTKVERWDDLRSAWVEVTR